MDATGFVINVNSEDPARAQRLLPRHHRPPAEPGHGRGRLAWPAQRRSSSTATTTSPAPPRSPPRMLLDFFVDDLAAEQKRLEAAGVKFIRTAGKEQWGGVISTFLDPDGNYCQLIEYKPSSERPGEGGRVATYSEFTQAALCHRRRRAGRGSSQPAPSPLPAPARADAPRSDLTPLHVHLRGAAHGVSRVTTKPSDISATAHPCSTPARRTRRTVPHLTAVAW